MSCILNPYLFNPGSIIGLYENVCTSRSERLIDKFVVTSVTIRQYRLVTTRKSILTNGIELHINTINKDNINSLLNIFRTASFITKPLSSISSVNTDLAPESILIDIFKSKHERYKVASSDLQLARYFIVLDGKILNFNDYLYKS